MTDAAQEDGRNDTLMEIPLGNVISNTNGSATDKAR